MALIQCENISIAYEGQTVIEDLSFQMDQGDYLCIVGENGSGKSTLVKSLLGLKSPSKGKIIFGDGLLQREIGYLPQQNDVQKDFPASVYEVVLSGRLNGRGFHPFYKAEDKRRAKENMQLLGIDDLARSCFRDLSGGQKQRVLLARALCATKKLLLLDEPAAGMNPNETGELMDMIRFVRDEFHMTILLIEHDMKLVSGICEELTVLNFGEVLAQGKTTDVLNDPQVIKAYLGE